MQYENSTGELMMLPTDMALVQDPKFEKFVVIYHEDEATFFKARPIPLLCVLHIIHSHTLTSASVTLAITSVYTL